MKIESYKKLKNGKYEVKFENDTKILLYEDAILDAELLRKKEISENELNRIVALNERYEVYNKSIKFLSVKMRCEKEIKSKFKNYSRDALIYTLERLRNEGYLNNTEYIKAYINDQLNLKDLGPNKIKKELNNLGFKEIEYIDFIDVIEDEIWSGKIAKLINKIIKSNHTKSNSSLAVKITSDLINKGYPTSLITNELYKVKFEDDTEFLEKEFNKLYRKYKDKFSKDELKAQLSYKLFQKGFDKEKISKVINKEL